MTTSCIVFVSKCYQPTENRNGIWGTFVTGVIAPAAGSIEFFIHLNTLVVYRIEFDKTKWSCPWNSDLNYTKQDSPPV